MGEPSKTSKEPELIVSVGLLPCDESRRSEEGGETECAAQERPRNEKNLQTSL